MLENTFTMHGSINVRFINAKQAKETPKENCTKQMQQSGTIKSPRQREVAVKPDKYPMLCIEF
jgi:hypothetical protein